ncbi:hypothetical protein PS6_004075 [Mucor atramentarius]
MATATVTIAATMPAPLTDPKGIHVLFSLPLTEAKTKVIVDIAVTRVTASECQICQFNHAFYKGKTQLFRFRSSPEQDKENGEMLLEHYKSTKQLVFKMKYNRKKGFKYDREANKLVEVVWIKADITLKKVESTCM